ncbi:MAG: substrate binding domain-containing protein, partial [Myxococcota bacterium]
GVLRIASPPFLATRFLAPAVESFLAAYPEVCVHLEVGLDHDRLVESNLDLAFRIGPLADSATVARAVGRARIVGVGTPERVAAIAARHPDDLRGLPFLCYGIAPHRTTWAHYVFERGDERRTIEVRGLLQVNRHEIVHAACRAGVALAVLPWVLVQSDVEAGALVRVLPEWRIPLVDLYVLRPSRPAKSPAVDAFLEHIEPLLRAAPWSAQPRPA